MKHLFVARAIYPAEVGGPSNTIYQMAKGLKDAEVVSSDRGMNDLIRSEHSIKLGELNNIDGVNIWIFKSLFQHPLSIQITIWLWKNVKRFDFVHLSSFFAPLSLVSAIICILRGVSFSIAPRGELYNPALQLKSLSKIIAIPLYRRIYSRATIYIVTSDDEKKSIITSINEKPERILVTPNPYNFSEFDVRYNSERKYILYIGRITSIKNIEMIIDSYSIIYNNRTSTPDLFIAGTGDKEYINKLRARVKNYNLCSKVYFIGHVTGEKKTDLFNSAIVTILVSKSENFGNVVVESLGYGVPVITSTGTPWSKLPENNCGEWIPPEIGSIAEAITKYIELSIKDYDDISSNCLSYATTNYSSEFVMSKFENKLKKLIIKLGSTT